MTATMIAPVVAFIFARGGSKGVPGKNVRMLCGRPLIAWAIKAAQACPAVSRVVVSTDDDAIADAARACGAEVPFMRPAALAVDEAPEWLAWRHALDMVEAADGPGAVGTFLSVPTTCPLRLPEDLDACLGALDEEADIAITVCEPSHNPYFTMVVLDETGYAARPMRADGPVWRRQMAPEVHGIAAVAYATRPAYVRSAEGVLDGRVRAVRVPRERAVDIDTELDFIIAECLMRHRLESAHARA